MNDVSQTVAATCLLSSTPLKVNWGGGVLRLAFLLIIKVTCVAAQFLFNIRF